MRRIVSVILVMIMVIGLIACGGKGEKADNTNVTSQSEQGKDTGKEKIGTQETVKVSNMQTWNRVASEDYVYIDYYEEMLPDKNAWGDIFLVSDREYYVELAIDIKKQSQTLEDTIKTLGMNAISEIEPTSKLRSTAMETGGINVTSSKEVKIANLDALQFTGTVKNREDKDEPMYDCHIYGYSFVIDNCPSLVFGIITKPEQSEEVIKKMDSQIDVMMSTVRTTE